MALYACTLYSEGWGWSRGSNGSIQRLEFADLVCCLSDFGVLLAEQILANVEDQNTMVRRANSSLLARIAAFISSRRPSNNSTFSRSSFISS